MVHTPSDRSSHTSNRYCDRLRIPVPDLDEVAASSEASLFQLMVAALLERGAPMTFDEIAARVERLTLPPRLARVDVRASLKKAWHGRPPIVEDSDGRLALDLLFGDWWYLLARMERDRRPYEPSSRRPAAFETPADTVPLSAEEVDAAFRNRSLTACSPLRLAAAMLEIAGEPLTLNEINERLKNLTRWAWPIREETVGGWRRDLVVPGPPGTLRINQASAEIPAFRRAIRKMAEPTLRARAQSERLTAEWQASPERAERRERRRLEVEDARGVRRGLVHMARGADDVVQGAAIVDVERRTIRTFANQRSAAAGSTGGASDAAGRAFIADIASELAAYDLLAGVDLRASLRALGLDPERWWLAELRPTARTHSPAEGKPIPVTLDGCIRATTRARLKLTDKAGWSLLAERPAKARVGARVDTRLEARLEEEARTLFAFYQYGALHGGVRVRNRPGDTCLLPVWWSMVADPDLHGIVRAAERWWSPFDIVLGSPPDLDDPWKGARRLDIVEDYWPKLYVRQQAGAGAAGGVGAAGAHGAVGAAGAFGPAGAFGAIELGTIDEISALDIFAMRILDDRAAESVRPGRISSGFDERALQVKVTLEGIEPPIWRRVAIPASNTLDRFHAILQAALGWTNSHLHVFEVEGERIGIPYELESLYETFTRSSRIIGVGDLVDRGVRRFTYEYDFGDGWLHTVEIEDVHSMERHGRLPRCLAGARACPPEDCGGAGGYERMLEILFDPRHEEFEEMRRWVGPDFEPDRFDLQEVNDRLASVGWRGYSWI
jgi:hypothetical protein